MLDVGVVVVIMGININNKQWRTNTALNWLVKRGGRLLMVVAIFGSDTKPIYS